MLQIYKGLLQEGVIVLREEELPPTVPIDYTWARVSEISAFAVLNSSFLYF